MTEPKNALVKQYQELFKIEGVKLHFSDESLAAMAKEAVKRKSGARGLRAIMEETMLDIMYEIPSMEFMGFKKSKIVIPSNTVKQGLIKKYDTNRNFPSINGTSRLGIHFRFGTISIREKARAAQQINATFLSELIWRDFYAMIMSNFPHVVNNPFRAKYDYIEWVNNEDHFQKWCEGKTGYHIVDAGMRELNSTGFMHNRVRMVTASFLIKKSSHTYTPLWPKNSIYSSSLFSVF